MITWRVILRTGGVVTGLNRAEAIKRATDNGDAYLVNPINKDVWVIPPDVKTDVIKYLSDQMDKSAYKRGE